MKIAMVFPTKESEKAISSYSIYLVEALKKSGIDVDPINYTAGSYKSFLKIFSKLKEYDIIHIQHEYNLLGGYGIPFFLAYLKLKHLKKQKIVTTMHTVLSQKEKFSGNILKISLRKMLYRLKNRLIKKVSSSIIVHSQFFAPILVREYDVPREKITIIPQGIIENVKITKKNKAKKELGLKGPVYLIIGNLVPDHGADIPLRYANKIGKNILVVSSPKPVNDRRQKRLADYLNYLQEFVKDKDFSKYVRFDIEHINDKMPKWWKYFSAADFVLQTYLGGIGSGIFAHAMASKTPVIATNIPFFKDIAKEYNCLKIVQNDRDLPSVIKEALKTKNYNKMIKECERYLKENNWNAVAEKYKKIYFHLIK